MKRYGKDGDAVRYATATNMVNEGISRTTRNYHAALGKKVN